MTMILIMAFLKLHISTWVLRSPLHLEKNGLDILSLQDTIITMTFITTVTMEIVEELKQHLTDDLENMRPPYKPGLWGDGESINPLPEIKDIIIARPY